MIYEICFQVFQLGKSKNREDRTNVAKSMVIVESE